MRLPSLWLAAVLLGGLPSGASAKAEPTPTAMVQYKGESLPFFAPTVKEAKPRSTVKPLYPRDETGQRISRGAALIVVLVDEKGRVAEAEIVNARPDPAVGLAALNAVKQWRYRRLTFKGAPTRYLTDAEVHFNAPP